MLFSCGGVYSLDFEAGFSIGNPCLVMQIKLKREHSYGAANVIFFVDFKTEFVNLG